MTEAEYWGLVQSISAEVADALNVFQTYEEILKLSLEHDAVFLAFNANARFWNIQKVSLQTTLIIALSRLFETKPNRLSMHFLLNETLAHPEFFSKDALRKRKIDLKIRPECLDALIDRAWSPGDGSELRYLKKALAPHARKFQEIYMPIRHWYYAHRLLQTEKPIEELFSKTDRNELGKSLDFLHELVDGLWQLYQNGTKPELGVRDFTKSNDKLRESVREIIHKIAGLEGELTE